MTSHLLTIPRFWGPLFTIIFTLAYHAGSLYFHYSITLIWIMVFVVWGTFASGLRGGLIAAAWGILYALYAIPMTDQLNRAIQVSIGIIMVAGLVGWQTRSLRRSLAKTQAALLLAEKNQVKANLVDSANGNIEKLRTALKMLDDLLMGWDVLDDNSRRGLIIDIRAHLATLILLVFGWRKLAEAKRYAEEGE